jgi:hypothetical protein
VVDIAPVASAGLSMLLSRRRECLENTRNAEALLEKLRKKIHVLGVKAVAQQRRPEPHFFVQCIACIAGLGRFGLELEKKIDRGSRKTKSRLDANPRSHGSIHASVILSSWKEANRSLWTT